MIPISFDVYVSEEDGTLVVHVDTEGLQENAEGPIMRLYVNDGEAVYANPPYPGGVQ